jgi:FlaA1/EpsC-like NDP-sugar epimerase
MHALRIANIIKGGASLKSSLQNTTIITTTASTRPCVQSIVGFPIQNITATHNQIRNSSSNRNSTSSMAQIINTVKSTIAENLGGPSHKLASDEHYFDIDKVPDQSGKVAVITGGSEGIGYGCSHTLLSHGIKHVYILSTSQEVVDGAKSAVAEELGKDAAERITWLQCDLADWPRVKEVAEKIKQETDRIDILINNAGRGIMTFQLTEYGVDRYVSFLFFLSCRKAYTRLINTDIWH